jgi:hypothetical protein
MPPIIETLFEDAFRLARAHAGNGDLAHAALAGLRLLRRAADRMAGQNLARGIDATVRDELLADALRRRAASWRDPAPVPLPEPGAGLRRAAALVENAAANALALNASTPDNSALDAAVRSLARRLPDLLGGTPDREAVIDALREGDDGEELPPAAWTVLPAGRIAVH